MLISIVFWSLVIMFASLVGVFSVWKRAGTVVERNLHFLVSFSAGVFLVVAFNLGHEALLHSVSFTMGLLWILFGTVSILVAFKLLPFFHHHHNDDTEECEHHSTIDAKKILWSDAIHNLGDGILLTASFGVSATLGVITALSILVHELVQEVSEFFVLKQSGYSTPRALGLNFLASSTILLGAIGSFFLLEMFEIIEVPVLGIAAGSFFAVVAHDLIPHSIKSPTFKIHYLRHIVWFLVGLIVMVGVNSFLTHSHDHEEHEVTINVSIL